METSQRRAESPFYLCFDSGYCCFIRDGEGLKCQELEAGETQIYPGSVYFPGPDHHLCLVTEEVQRPATCPIIFPFIEEALLRHSGQCSRSNWIFRIVFRAYSVCQDPCQSF